MSNARGKSIDKTFLSVDNAEERGFIHRDYIAHCLRWSHVIRHLTRGMLYKEADVLDIGCGKEVPLAKTMYSSRLIPVTGSYTGIDVNHLTVPEMFSTGKFPIELIGGADVCTYDFGKSTFRVITCFEVLEHVEPEHSYRMLRRIRELLEDEGTAFLSTPVYDPATGAAANHVNEMSYSGLEFLIQRAGLKVEAVYGTFASQKDYKHLLTPEESAMFDRLSQYYDSNYLATVFAPLYPKNARNCLWRVRRNGDNMELFTPDELLADPRHSSSDKWVDFIKGIQDAPVT